jgi:hypothetical protein
MALLDVQFDECTRTRVSGWIAADERHHQPWGIVHGGLYTTAIETFATTAAEVEKYAASLKARIAELEAQLAARGGTGLGGIDDKEVQAVPA